MFTVNLSVPGVLVIVIKSKLVGVITHDFFKVIKWYISEIRK